MGSRKKVFVLDTNVLLHDYKCLYNFQDNDLVIPITVLEELDKFKKGFDQINFNARQIARELTKLSTQEIFSKGVSLGDGLGKLFIVPYHKASDAVQKNFPEISQDHKILAIAEFVKNTRKEPVIFVSKDVNLRLKALSIGIKAEDYETDKVTNMEIFSGYETITLDDTTKIANLFHTHQPIDPKEVEIPITLDCNKHFIVVQKGTETVYKLFYDLQLNRILPVIKQHAYGIEPRNIEQQFALDALLNPSIPLVSITGKAGTGKTLLALAAALEMADNFDQILLARPIIPLSNRDMGFLPGDVKEKMGPYMLPLYDNIGVIKTANKKHSKQSERIDQMLKDQQLVIEPLAYIRGRSLSNVYFIIDEAQNLTPHEIKTIITRAGDGSKIVFTGDVQQIDTPYLDQHSNGLTYLTAKMKNQPLFAHIHLQKGERSALAELASDIL
ncbi:MAG TPA: PhoH family protein [Salinivirgaceae bacterium]|nr:PhoH family protein [Salinivirgaceae bacterium]